VSNYRVSVPGTPSGIRAPPTIRHSQYSRATHGSPPARGGWGGGRAALDDPTNSTPQTPRCARCFRRFREPFPETRPPPPDPPLAGGELCSAQQGFCGAGGKGDAGGAEERKARGGNPLMLTPPLQTSPLTDRGERTTILLLRLILNSQPLTSHRLRSRTCPWPTR